MEKALRLDPHYPIHYIFTIGHTHYLMKWYEEAIMTEEERNLETVKHWEHLYNTDVKRMISECYAENAEVRVMGGLVIRDSKHFLAVEEAVLRAAPSRRMRIERTLAKGDTVVIEAVLLDTDKDTGEAWETPWCAVHTFEDGKIVVDRTYLDQRKWPGI